MTPDDSHTIDDSHPADPPDTSRRRDIRDNDTRGPDPRQALCDELAETLATEGGQRLLRLLDAVPGLGRSAPDLAGAATPPVDPPEAEPDVSSPVDDGPEPISLWQPRQLDGRWVFERPPVHPLGDHYSARRRFDLVVKPGVTRVCFLGESVAAGYLLAPYWTPALALEQRLQELSGAGGSGVSSREVSNHEVIDLARTNERLDTMFLTARRALQLNPAVLVLFAGNNWNLLDSPEGTLFETSNSARQRLAADWRREGARGPVERARRQLRRRLDTQMAALATKARAAGSRVVVVIPEVELASWEMAQPLAWTTHPGGVARWHALHQACVDQLEQGQAATALATAEAMATLDGGEHPTSQRLRMRAYQALDAPDAAHQAAQAAVDGAALPRLGCLGAPQISSESQGWLRQLAERLGLAVVDLPWLLATDEGLPGSALFLDYCHLTCEGIDRAMTVTAETVLAALDREPVVESSALPPLVVPDPVRALAAVGAAVHGAHRHLPVDRRGFDSGTWLRRAVDRDPAILPTLVDLAEARTGPLPEVLTRAQQRQTERSERLLLQHGWRWDCLDADLLRALFAVLDTHAPEEAAALRQRLVRHHGVDHQPRNLGGPPDLWQPLARLLPEVMREAEASRRATLRAAWPRTDLILVTEDPEGVLLDLVLRLPAIEGWDAIREGDVQIQLNGVEVASVQCGETWTRSGLRLPATDEAGPLHRVTLQWPPLPAADPVALDAVLTALEEGREADFFPLFGEVERCAARRPAI